MFRTTINIHEDTLTLLSNLSVMLGTPRDLVIKSAMHLLSKEMKHRDLPQRLVQYQESDVKENWRSLHIKLSFEQYAHFVDMRNFFKMSVSFLIALALQKYGQTLLKEKEISDKNLFEEYFITKKVHGGLQYFMICWEDPKVPG